MSGKAPGVGLICELAEDGDLEEMQKLLYNSPHLVDAQDPEGKSPLHSACDYGHEDIVAELLERGVDVNIMTQTGNILIVETQWNIPE